MRWPILNNRKNLTLFYKIISQDNLKAKWFQIKNKQP
jgi:hypothetical protein